MGSGRIITFYSYKGGTGRSMALANVAWILASNGKKVLVLDWDLEAPGLHRYLAPFLRDKDLTASDGLIDFVIKFATAAAKPAEELSAEERTDEGWFLPYANILRYATSIDWEFDNSGTIDFIPAGRQGPSYSTRVNSFNWQFFYDRLGGGVLLERAKDRMRAEYDYVLIDSRTGVSDTSGICTVQMPDDLVVCFTLNNQSIEGAAAVARSVHEQRTAAGKPVDIFPVAMRVESGEKGKLEARKALARERFREFPSHLGPEERERYWGEAQVSYVPYYAYEEILAGFGDNFTDRFSVLAACEQITFYVTRHEVAKLVPPSKEDRSRVLLAYEGGAALDKLREQEQFAEGVFGRFSPEDRELVPRVLTRLVRVPGVEELGGATPRWARLEEIEGPAARMIQPLVSAGLLVQEGERIRIADHALLAGWPRLGKWIEEDRAFLLWRQRLQDRIAEWLREDKDRSFLLSGTPLKKVSDLLVDSGDRLNDVEQAYIQQSLEMAESRPGPKTPRRRRWATWAAGTACVLVILVLTLAFPPATKLDIQTIEIPQDTWILSEDRSLAVALSSKGSEPLIIWRTEAPWNTGMRVQIPLEAIRVSAKGSYLAGITKDGSLYVWPLRKELGSGTKPATKIALDGMAPSQVGFEFSPNENWLYVFASGTLSLVNSREAISGSAVSTHLIRGAGRRIVFSPKGKFAASFDKNIGTILLTFSSDSIGERRLGGHYRENQVYMPFLIFSQDEKWLSVAKGTHVSLFDLETLRERWFSFAGKSGRVFGSQGNFSPDGKWIFYSGEDPSENPTGHLYSWRLSDYPDGRQTAAIGYARILDFGGKNWVAAAEGEKLFVWPLGKSPQAPLLRLDGRGVVMAKFSPRGDWIAAGRQKIYVWKTGTPPRAEILAATYSGSGVDRIYWCQDNEHLFTLGPSEIFWGRAGEPLDRVFSSISSPVQDLLVTPDGRTLVIFGSRGLSFVQRRFSVWNRALWTLNWPALAEPQQDEQ